MEILPYRPELEGELLRFLRTQFPGSPQKGERDFFRWRFDQNPLGSSLDSYCVAVDHGRIIGQLGAIRDRLWVKGKWRDCCWLVDLILSPEHRGAKSSAAPQLFEQLARRSPLLLITGAGPRLLRYYLATGWSYREITGTYYAVRRPSRLLSLASVSGEARAPAGSWALRTAEWLLSGLQAAGLVTREAMAGKYDYRLLTGFGKETDELIDSAMPGGVVSPWRSAASLNWKFNQRPVGLHVAIGAYRRGSSKLSGYLTAKLMERKPHAKWMEIIDFLEEPGEQGVFDGLLDCAMHYGMDADVDFYRLRCSLPRHRNRLRLPFWIRRDRRVIDGTFFKTGDSGLRDYLANEDWHLTSVVSDKTDHGADEWPPNTNLIKEKSINDTRQVSAGF